MIRGLLFLGLGVLGLGISAYAASFGAQMGYAAGGALAACYGLTETTVGVAHAMLWLAGQRPRFSS